MSKPTSDGCLCALQQCSAADATLLSMHTSRCTHQHNALRRVRAPVWQGSEEGALPHCAQVQLCTVLAGLAGALRELALVLPACAGHQPRLQGSSRQPDAQASLQLAWSVWQDKNWTGLQTITEQGSLLQRKGGAALSTCVLAVAVPVMVLLEGWTLQHATLGCAHRWRPAASCRAKWCLRGP